MTHYLMVARLSNRCFDLVVKLGQEKKVTQSDFLALYKKTEAQQHQLLLDLLAGRKTFDELKKERVCFFMLCYIFVFYLFHFLELNNKNSFH